MTLLFVLLLAGVASSKSPASADSVAIGTLLPPAPAATDIRPGMRFRDCPECPEMVVIPAGHFTMRRKRPSDGRRDDDPEGVPKSLPARDVIIPRSFAVAVYDVTRDDYAAFARETGRSGTGGCYVWKRGVIIDDKSKNWQNPGFSQTGRDPVVCVNFDDAQAYVSWLNSKVGRSGQDHRLSRPYRLMTWAEAEYAAAGGAPTAYPWGDQPLRTKANYGKDLCLPCGPEREDKRGWLYTSPVGAFPPNSFGLYDVSGNVWQLTGSCLRQDPEVNSDGDCSGITHGGSWLTNPEYLQVGEDRPLRRQNRNIQTGFRVARTLD